MISELSQALAAIDLAADWIGLRAVKSAIGMTTVRDGLPQRNGRSHSQGVMVEVLAGGQIGYSAVNSLRLIDLQAAAEAAYRQAIAASKWAIFPTSTAARPKVVGQYASPVQKALDLLSPGEINEILVRLCHEMKRSDAIVQTSATAVTDETESWFVSSNGSEVHQKFVMLETHFGATAQDGSIVQRRSSNGYLAHSYQGGWELFLTPELWEQAKTVGEQAIELLTAAECPSETTTLVLAPDQMMLQIHESVGHPLELDRILGDERNYAGGSFVKPADFGSLSYGSKLMNITFNPDVEGEFASYRFDDIGAPASKEYLIREGVLQRGLGSLESQQRLGVPGVACARASSWNRPPIDRMANINLEAGTENLHALIGNIERGVFMEANQSWSIDDQRYKFQFGCEYAKRIENGKLTKTLRNPNYRATTPQFWHSLAKVGDTSTWEVYGTPLCGKGEPNQAIRVGHGSPVCVFENIEVFGGGA
ncbi:TldD/PmbA family protein [Microcoleus sp. FACHB-1515]|uniref:TldD/PmbA family protein n=1 Tax=Cyanophyceae TaxID=3028117 RepID=UPI0016890042|nr:TldD/PmbA family protein [Microcoleus sp. FACHB-1515]MBD2092089.1 TldD/PmbA family protein [Microcoleus sp. FACHB-1515]